MPLKSPEYQEAAHYVSLAFQHCWGSLQHLKSSLTAPPDPGATLLAEDSTEQT